MKEHDGYIVITNNGMPCIDTADYYKKWTIKKWLSSWQDKTTWKFWYRGGYRLRKFKLNILGQHKE